MSSPSQPEYIESDEQFVSFATRAAGSAVLAIDTEFIREKTYYPKLCLLQLATNDEVAIVDPFTVRDLSPLREIMRDPATVKLLHAGGQDLEIIYRELGILPDNVFDVQVAASLLGQSQQAGLASIVSAFLGVSINKSDSFTDWAIRPLAESQLAYAAGDVIYLPELHRVMTSRLEEMGRLHWLDDDFEAMCDPARYDEDPFERYKRLKRGNQLNRKQAAAAREVAAWREVEARERNVPRKWVLTDEQIVESCKRESKTIDELFLIRGMRNSLSTRDARHVVQLMVKAFASDPDSWPRQEMPGAPERNVDSAVDLLTALVRVRAKEEDIAMQTLASHGDLVQVARGHFDGTPVMHGWRKKILGDDMAALLDGRMSMRLVDGELVLERTDV